MEFEYKVVGAPEKGRRQRGARTRSDRVAAAFEDVLKAEAVDGWEYLRTDLVPVEEKHGMFRRREEIHRAVMVFRRPRHAPRRREGPAEDELVLLPEARSRPRKPPRRAEPEIRLAHSSDDERRD